MKNTSINHSQEGQQHIPTPPLKEVPHKRSLRQSPISYRVKSEEGRMFRTTQGVQNRASYYIFQFLRS